MQFNSLIFVFVFMPIVLSVFYGLRRFGTVNSILLWLTLSSLVFYAWWSPIYSILIISSMLANYFIGRGIEGLKISKPLMIGGILLNLGLLGYFKYFNFFLDTVDSVTNSHLQVAPIALPLAISFFTFQQIAYLVDTYKTKKCEKSPLKYGLFVTFFPQLIAGPIVHHAEMMPQFQSIKTKTILFHTTIVEGLTLFTIGLAKKVILADGLAEFADPLFNTDLSIYSPTAWEAWTATFAYTGQIYFDFSGYCDMAMGLALLFGIRLPLNFNSPYKSKNISEFWRLWHITLGRFLRDYLYIPLGGNRVPALKQARNVIIVMFLGGLWHGANWTFIVWGLIHGFLLAIHAQFTKYAKITIPNYMAVFITFMCVAISWIYFRSDSLDDANIIIKALFNFDLTRLPELYDAPSLAAYGFTTQLPGLYSIHALYWIITSIFIYMIAPNSVQISQFCVTKVTTISREIWLGALLMSIIILMIINECKETSAFIYFNF